MNYKIENDVRAIKNELGKMNHKIENDVRAIRDELAMYQPMKKIIKYCVLVAIGSVLLGETKCKSDLYQSALARYADTNRDNVVSKLEEETFKSNLLKDKDAVFVRDWPMSKSGDAIPFKTIKEWFDSYVPKEQK